MWNAWLTPQIARAQDRLLWRLHTDRVYAEAMSHEPLHARVGDWVTPEGGKQVLELGCGPGKYVAMLGNLGLDVTGVDPHSFPSWDLLRSRPTCRLLPGVHAESLPFENGAFDHVVCLGALLYFEHPALALAEVRRVLRPGGHLVLRTVNSRNLYTLRTGKRLDPASRQLYTRPQLVALLQEAGFAVTHEFSYGFWPPWAGRMWWYLVCVWIPDGVQNWLSACLPEEHRVNHVVFAVSAPTERQS